MRAAGLTAKASRSFLIADAIVVEALTVTDVMKVLNVKDRDTVYALVRSGRLVAVRLGREYRFHPDVVDDFLRGRRDDLLPPSYQRKTSTNRGTINLPPVPNRIRRPR